MAQPFHLIFLGNNLMGETANVVGFKQMKAQTLEQLLITVGEASDTDAIFNLKINGVAQFVGANRPKIAAGQTTVIKSGLSITINQFDKVTIDLESGDAVSPIEVGFKFSGMPDIWIGTQSEYDLLTPNSETLYFITEE